jgi:hypothetical protein
MNGFKIISNSTKVKYVNKIDQNPPISEHIGQQKVKIQPENNKIFSL